MSETPPPEPASELAKHLLASARRDEPSAASVQRAHALVDARVSVVSLRPTPSRRWALWALPAAAALFGLVMMVTTQRAAPVNSQADREQDAPTPSISEVKVVPTDAPTENSAVAAAPSLGPSANPSANPSAAPSATASTRGPEAVAQRSPRPAPAAPPSPAPPPPAASPPPARAIPCDCSPNDLMCAMRCGQKK